MKTLENVGTLETVGQWSFIRVQWQGLWLTKCWMLKVVPVFYPPCPFHKPFTAISPSFQKTGKKWAFLYPFSELLSQVYGVIALNSLWISISKERSLFPVLSGVVYLQPKYCVPFKLICIFFCSLNFCTVAIPSQWCYVECCKVRWSWAACFPWPRYRLLHTDLIHLRFQLRLCEWKGTGVEGMRYHQDVAYVTQTIARVVNAWVCS